ncbi:alpha/beta fold hydrolase [Cryptosporangium sp. NPDC051539]|uniref:alpha/beta fold hydrolase n=1 Tax=Cryptosporangium sp. NPDC051539 TaxID=3363962 RepID=UPI0037A4C093
MATNVVLVHGAWADGSGWRAVHDLLTADGLAVSVVQNPTVTLAEDAAATRRILDRQDGPTILVGHSYGGAVITEAGTHERVAALVYVAAFAPDKGESVNTLIPEPSPGVPVPPILPPADGFLFLDREKFHEAFAADLPADDARFLAASQTPWGLGAIGGVITEAAWRSKPSSYVLTTGDRMIPPVGQRSMAERMGATVTEVDASHAVYVSRPESVAAVIRAAV